MRRGPRDRCRVACAADSRWIGFAERRPRASHPTRHPVQSGGDAELRGDHRRIRAHRTHGARRVRGRSGRRSPAGPSGAPAAAVVLVGNAGGELWPRFQAGRRDEPHPLDTWTCRTVEPRAAALGVRAIYPNDRPYQPFQRWAMRAEPVAPSPIGLLIHPDHGLWHAYRAALLLDTAPADLPAREDRPSPCTGSLTLRHRGAPNTARHAHHPQRSRRMDRAQHARHRQSDRRWNGSVLHGGLRRRSPHARARESRSPAIAQGDGRRGLTTRWAPSRRSTRGTASAAECCSSGLGEADRHPGHARLTRRRAAVLSWRRSSPFPPARTMNDRNGEREQRRRGTRAGSARASAGAMCTTSASNTSTTIRPIARRSTRSCCGRSVG